MGPLLLKSLPELVVSGSSRAAQAPNPDRGNFKVRCVPGFLKYI